MNGRVIFDEKPGISYHLFEREQESYSYDNTLRGIQGKNTLSDVFFDRKNIDNIHNQIINEVSKKTSFRIGKQSETELQLIMRSIFLQFAKNQPCFIKEQVQELNKKVLLYCVDRIVVEISQYLEYKDTVNKMPMPLNHPKNISSAGNKGLTFFQPL